MADKNFTPTVAQMKLTKNGGSSYVVRLRDGSFIVIDGGESDKYDSNSYKANSETLWNYLSNNGKNHPIISAWMITHFHFDHVNCASEFLVEYKERMTVKLFAYNHYGYEDKVRCLAEEADWEAAMAAHQNAERYILKTGDKLTFDGATVDILISAADPYPEDRFDQNRISAAFKMTFDSGKSFFVFGDCDTERLSKLREPTSTVYRPDTELSCDFLQVPHHGLPMGEDEFLAKNRDLYEVMAPKISLYSICREKFATYPKIIGERFVDNQYLRINTECYTHDRITEVNMNDLSVTVK